jgi:hypothetical protein
MTTTSTLANGASALDTILQGDCIKVMSCMASAAVDFVLTDPPYIARYCSRTGQSVLNDDNGAWLQPAFTQIYRLLKPGSFCVSFYSWSKADRFIAAWRSAGFRMVGHLVFRKKYTSSARFLRYQHEQAYLLAKGDVTPPAAPMPDVLDWTYTGNRLHPTQKPVQVLRPLIEAFCPTNGVVLDPFCGSGSTRLPPRNSHADSSVSNLIARTISPRRGVSGKRRFAADDGSPLPRSLFGPPEAGRTLRAFARDEELLVPAISAPIGPRSGGQRRGCAAGPQNARSHAQGHAPSMASTIEDPPFEGREPADIPGPAPLR